MRASLRIGCLEDLRLIGAVAAFDRVSQAGIRASLGLLRALEGALGRLRWHDGLARTTRGC